VEKSWRIRKKTSYLQFCMGTAKGHQKNIFSTSRAKKKPKTLMRSIPRNLQSQPKIIKKIIGTSNQPNRTTNFRKKYQSMCKGAKHSYGG
jgi:hypothetical protein